MTSGWRLTAAQRALLMGPEQESAEKAAKTQRLLSMKEMEEMTRRTLATSSRETKHE